MKLFDVLKGYAAFAGYAFRFDRMSRAVFLEGSIEGREVTIMVSCPAVAETRVVLYTGFEFNAGAKEWAELNAFGVEVSGIRTVALPVVGSSRQVALIADVSGHNSLSVRVIGSIDKLLAVYRKNRSKIAEICR
ncbi:MAG: hypothetical protein ACI3WT_04395 [Phascolarctobacterium sp.]